MTTLIFGRGFLGERLARDLRSAVLSAADIADEGAVKKAIAHYAPSAVVNAAGKTGRPNVDWCEGHQQETTRSNVEGPIILARACASVRARTDGRGLLRRGYGEAPQLITTAPACRGAALCVRV